MDDKKKALILLFLCIFLWSLIPVAAKIGQNSLDSHQYLFWSSIVSFLTLYIITLSTGNLKFIKSYSAVDWIRIPVLGLLGTYIYYLLLYIGYSGTGGLEVLITQYTWPFLIVVLSIFILKERMTVRKLLSITLGFAGVFFVLSKGEFNISIDDPVTLLWVAAGAFCFALFSVLSKNVDREPIGVTMVYFMIAMVASFISLSVFSSFVIPTGSAWISVVVNGVFINGISYLFWIKALKLSDASFLAPFIYIVPALSAIFLILIFKEPFNLFTIAGIFLVIAGGLANNKK